LLAAVLEVLMEQLTKVTEVVVLVGIGLLLRANLLVAVVPLKAL
jgi:hypothetical protein